MTLNNPLNLNSNLLKSLATLLIANSHLEGLYPFRWLAGDGLLGNSLFFFLSGYGIFFSLSKGTSNFPTYYIRRIKRIYPSLLITVLIFQILLQKKWQIWTGLDYIRELVYPTSYLFITTIMIFYVLLFFIIKSKNEKLILFILFSLFIPYSYFYLLSMHSSVLFIALSDFSPWIFQIQELQVCLLGVYFALNKSNIEPKNLNLKIILYLTVYIFLKFLMVKYNYYNNYFLLHLLVFPIMFYFYKFSLSLNVANFINNHKPIHFLVFLLSSVTLEVYIVHEYVFSNSYILSLKFPFNIVIFYISTIVLSYLLKRCSDKCLKLVG